MAYDAIKSFCFMPKLNNIAKFNEVIVILEYLCESAGKKCCVLAMIAVDFTILG